MYYVRPGPQPTSAGVALSMFVMQPQHRAQHSLVCPSQARFPDYVVVLVATST